MKIKNKKIFDLSFLRRTPYSGATASIKSGQESRNLFDPSALLRTAYAGFLHFVRPNKSGLTSVEMTANGSILMVVVFTIALLTIFVVGMLEMNSEQIQIMKNEIFTAQAHSIAQAGLADALSRIRTAHSLPTNFNATFGGGSYSVQMAGSFPDPNITSTGTSAQGFVTIVDANITVDTAGSYAIRIDSLRIN